MFEDNHEGFQGVQLQLHSDQKEAVSKPGTNLTISQLDQPLHDTHHEYHPQLKIQQYKAASACFHPTIARQKVVFSTTVTDILTFSWEVTCNGPENMTIVHTGYFAAICKS